MHRACRSLRLRFCLQHPAASVLRRSDRQLLQGHGLQGALPSLEAKNYDLCLNAALGREACAQLIVQAAKAMQQSVT